MRRRIKRIYERGEERREGDKKMENEKNEPKKKIERIMLKIKGTRDKEKNGKSKVWSKKTAEVVFHRTKGQ